jgi:hypothetical protein
VIWLVGTYQTGATTFVCGRNARRSGSVRGTSAALARARAGSRSIVCCPKVPIRHTSRGSPTVRVGVGADVTGALREFRHIAVGDGATRRPTSGSTAIPRPTRRPRVWSAVSVPRRRLAAVASATTVRATPAIRTNQPEVNQASASSIATGTAEMTIDLSPMVSESMAAVSASLAGTPMPA